MTLCLHARWVTCRPPAARGTSVSSSRENRSRKSMACSRSICAKSRSKLSISFSMTSRRSTSSASSSMPRIGGEFVAGLGEMIHADVPVAGPGQLLDDTGEDLELVLRQRQILDLDAALWLEQVRHMGIAVQGDAVGCGGRAGDEGNPSVECAVALSWPSLVVVAVTRKRGGWTSSPVRCGDADPETRVRPDADRCRNAHDPFGGKDCLLQTLTWRGGGVTSQPRGVFRTHFSEHFPEKCPCSPRKPPSRSIQQHPTVWRQDEEQARTSRAGQARDTENATLH